MGSLGGEISSAFVNPAGLGVFKTSEFVVSPGFRYLTDKSDYLGTSLSGKSANNFNLGTSGMVLSYTGRNGNSNAFSVAVNRMANFNSNVHYSGVNDYSSGSEQYVEEFAASGYSIDQGLASPGLSYGTRMALYTYLIDTATINGKFAFHLFAALAEFERALTRERTQAGLAAARARGRKGGRPKLLPPEKRRHAVALYQGKKHSIAEICRLMGISKPTLYSYVDEAVA